MAHAPAPGDKKNIVKMAYIYFQEGRWDKAIEEYRKLLAIDPEDVNTHNMLGDVFVKKGSIKEAYAAYIKVATELASRGQQDKAVVVHKKIAALDPTTLPPDARAKQNLLKQSLRAETAMEQGDFQTAIEAFSDVLKLDPENLPAYGKLAELLVSSGKTAEAVQQYAVLGAAFLKNRLYKKALEAFQKIVDLDPNQVEARINLAQIYIKQGSESDAKKEFLTVAEICMQQGDLEKAQQYAAKAIEFKSIEAHYVLGQALFRRRQYAEAKGEFENLLRFKVNHVGALVHLGLVHLELNQLDKAAEQLGKAQKAEKDNPKVMEALADLNAKKGLKNEAVALLVQASEWYHAKKDYAKAVEVAKKAEAIDYQSPSALWAMGIALKDEGQKSEAVSVLVRAIPLFEQQGMKLEAESAQSLIEELSGKAHVATHPNAASQAPVAQPPAAGADERSDGESILDLDADDKSAVDSGAVPAAESVVEPEAGIETETVGEPDATQAPENEAEISPLEENLEGTETAAGSVEPVAEEVLPPVNPEEELAAQLEIAANYIRQNLVEEAIEIYQQLLESHPDHPEVRTKLNEAYTLYVKGGDEVIDALEAERKAKEEEEKRLREEVERRAHEERDRQSRAERERKEREEAEAKIREESLQKAKREAEFNLREEALHKAKQEAERLLKGERTKRVNADSERAPRDEKPKAEKAGSGTSVREEIERKLRLEVEQKLRGEIQQKVNAEAEQKLRDEMQRNARVEAEKKVRAEMERNAREEAEKKIRAEMERNAREEAEKKIRAEIERNAREEAEKKIRAEMEQKLNASAGRGAKNEPARKTAEPTDKLSSRGKERVDASGKSSAKPSPSSQDAKDDFMTIAVADIYIRQGLFEEAYKIFQRITEMEPDNFEAKKKLTDLENLMKAKGIQKPSEIATAPPSPVKETSAPVPPPPSVSQHEKDSVAKKKHGKVGYV